jgi:uncharacterized protein
LPEAFHVIAKPCGAICNLDCRYCFYLPKEDLYTGSVFRMTDELLERYVRQLIGAHRTREVTFSWQGGEPTLMGLDFFRRAIQLQQKYRRPGTEIRNALQTNATLLDGEWCRFFKENGFLIGASLDGPRDIHDTYRSDKGGAPTFDRVMGGIALLKEHSVEFNILACVHAASAGRGLDVYRFLRDEVRAPVVQFIPIVHRQDPTGLKGSEAVTAQSITGRKYGEFLIEVFDEWVRRDVGRVFVQIFDMALGIWCGAPSTLCVHAETCGDAPALEHNGDLFACDHYVDPRHMLGNISDTDLAYLVSSPQQRKFGADKRDALPGACRRCGVRFACNGGCPKDRLTDTEGGEPGLNALCEGYKNFFTHIEHPMKIMADLLRQRRSPAGIMPLMAASPRVG